MSELHEVVCNHVLRLLNNDQVALSFQVRLVDSVEIASIARAAGYDTLYVDIEHSSFSLRQTSQICIAALATGIMPFVRVPAIDGDLIPRVLDGGAMGVIVPHVTNADEARRVVRASKFPPLGDRSVSTGLPQLQFQPWPLNDARRALNENTAVVVMLEGPEALENAEEIAAVEGVDILFIGTNDLCAQLGIDGQFDDPQVEAAYLKTIAAAKKFGKHVGIGGLASRPDLATRFVALGAKYVSCGSDLQYLLSGARDQAKLLRSSLEPAP